MLRSTKQQTNEKETPTCLTFFYNGLVLLTRRVCNLDPLVQHVPRVWAKGPLPPSFHQVTPSIYLDKSCGFEQVDPPLPLIQLN